MKKLIALLCISLVSANYPMIAKADVAYCNGYLIYDPPYGWACIGQWCWLDTSTGYEVCEGR